MQRRIFILLVLCASIPAAASPDRASEIVRKARAALGGESKLAEVRSLSLTGSLRRVTPDQDVDGKVVLSLVLPDKFRRDETLRIMGGDGPTLVNAWDGASEWRDVKTDALAGGVQIVRRAPPSTQPAPRRAIPETKADMARLALATLLSTPTSMPVEWSYVGPVETDAGAAEAVDATGADGFKVRLYVDAKTSMPMAIAYHGLEPPRAVFRTRRAPTPPPAGQPDDLPDIPAPREVDFQINLSDYKKVGAVLLPHRFEKLVDGTVVEEWAIEKAQVNPSIDASQFVNKK